MGVCTSGCADADLAGYEDDAPYGRGNYVVEIVQGKTPHFERVSRDPYVKFWIEDTASSTGFKGRKHRTLTRRGTDRPVWRSVREMGITPEQEDVLEVELWDDQSGSDTAMASVRIPIQDIDVRPKWFHMQPVDKEAHYPGGAQGEDSMSGVCLRFVPGDPPQRKTVYLIRHGESVWNQAQKDKNVGDMLDFDHPLNKTGIEQAQKLRQSWQEAAEAARGGAPGLEGGKLDGFLEADAIYSSPLSRALQTALVGLKDLPVAEREGLTLWRSIREIKGIGGLDCVGEAVGVEIAHRSETCMAEVMGPANAKNTMCVVDPGDAVSEWWTGVDDRDTTSSLNDRFIEVMNTLRYGAARAPILVGHSLFFKDFFKRFTGPAFERANKRLAADLQNRKISNAGCVAVDLEFNPNPTAGQASTPALRFCHITDAHLMFGTEFSEI